MSRFSKALGVWEIGLCDPALELKPTMQHVRKFRKILLEDQNRKDKNLLYDKFSDFMFEMVKERYSEENDDEMKTWIELHINPLFEEAMVAFKWTSKEELEKSKKEGIEDLKKKMSSV